MQGHRYRYVGPAELAVPAGAAARPIRSPHDLADWIGRLDARDRGDPCTYVVDVDGILRLAPRRSEHVVCAAGGDVLAAGEISFTREAARWRVREVSNQSTGYCPDPACWPAVAAALDRIGVDRPRSFTAEFVFRRCPGCSQLNVVKDGDFACSLCERALPPTWNI